MFLITLVSSIFFPKRPYDKGGSQSLKINTVGEQFQAVPSSPTYPYVQVTNSNSFFALR